MSESYFAEPQDKINRCLRCTRKECVNCLSGREIKESGRGRKIKNYNPELLQMLLESELTGTEICEVLQISRRTLIRYKKRLHDEADDKYK